MTKPAASIQDPIELRRPMDSREKAYDQLFETGTIKADIKSKSIRGGLFSFSSEGANLLVNIVSTSILARLLVPTDFGLLGMVFAITSIADRFKDIGLSTAIVLKKEINHAEVSNIFWINAAMGAAIFMIVALLSHPIANFYHEQRVTRIAIVLATTFIF